MTEFVAILHTTRSLEITEISTALDLLRDLSCVQRVGLIRKSQNAIVVTGTLAAPRRFRSRPASYRQLFLDALKCYRPIPLHALDVMMRGADELDPTASALTAERYYLVEDLRLCGVRL